MKKIINNFINNYRESRKRDKIKRLEEQKLFNEYQVKLAQLHSEQASYEIQRLDKQLSYEN